MKLAHIQPEDSVWTNYTGALCKHIVVSRTDYWFTLDNRRTVSTVYAWKNLAIFHLLYWRLKHYIGVRYASIRLSSR